MLPSIRDTPHFEKTIFNLCTQNQKNTQEKMQLTALGLITTVIIAILAYIAGLRKDSTDRLRSRDKKIFAEMISTIPDNIARYIE